MQHGVLFDKDGTLIDFDSTWVPLYRAAAAELADGDDEWVERMLLITGYDPVSGRCLPGTLLTVGTTDQMVSAWRPDLSGGALRAAVDRADEVFVEGASRNLTPLTDLTDLFQSLRTSGFRVGVATNDNTRSARKCFEALGVSDLLDFVTGYDGVANAKPAPDMMLAFCETCALEPANVVVVGDNIHDLEMGVAAGAGFTIGVLSGNAAESDFAERASVVLASVADVPDELARRMVQGA